MNKETVKFMAKEGLKTLASAGTVKLISKYVPLHPAAKLVLTTLLYEGFSQFEKKGSNDRRTFQTSSTRRGIA